MIVNTDGDTKVFQLCETGWSQLFRTCTLHGEVQSFCAVYGALVKINTIERIGGVRADCHALAPSSVILVG